MVSRRIAKSVLHNFLGTYTSRYSDYEGYWLFGFLVDELNLLEFDLLASRSVPDSAVGIAEGLAVTKFDEQVKKARLQPADFQHARLKVKRMPDSVEGSVNGSHAVGFQVVFQASAIMDNAKHYLYEATVFVAPHDPDKERRSSRGA